jgi:hypothetical protein
MMGEVQPQDKDSGVVSTAIYVGKLLHILEPGGVFC